LGWNDFQWKRYCLIIVVLGFDWLYLIYGSACISNSKTCPDNINHCLCIDDDVCGVFGPPFS